MKTLRELYTEVMADEELKKAYFAAAKKGNIESFLKEHDCPADRAELDAFLHDAKNLPQGEVADDELDAVAGGTCYYDRRPVVTALNCCVFWTCDTCHRERPKTLHLADNCLICGQSAYCYNCDYYKYEDAVWKCYHPKRYGETGEPEAPVDTFF